MGLIQSIKLMQKTYYNSSNSGIVALKNKKVIISFKKEFGFLFSPSRAEH